MVLDEPAVSAPHTPPRVSPPKLEEPLAQQTTPLRLPATPAQEGPSNTLKTLQLIFLVAVARDHQKALPDLEE